MARRVDAALLVAAITVALLAWTPQVASAQKAEGGERHSSQRSLDVPDGDGEGIAEEEAPWGALENLPNELSGEWSITTTDANGTEVGMETMPGESGLVAQAAGSWWDGQCGSNTSTANKFEVLKQYNRPKAHKRMEGSKAKMYCGKLVSTQSEAAFGLRHIRGKHKSQFADLAAMEGRDWGNFMHWSVSWTISDPRRRTVQNANRYCYQRTFSFTAPNGSVIYREVVVILGRTGVRIMNAYPSTNKTYCTGTLF